MAFCTGGKGGGGSSGGGGSRSGGFPNLPPPPPGWSWVQVFLAGFGATLVLACVTPLAYNYFAEVTELPDLGAILLFLP